MCKSLAEGGRRCAASLEPAFAKAIKAYRDNGSQLTTEMMNLILPAAKGYASTSTGYRVISNMISEETNRLLNTEEYKDFDFKAALANTDYQGLNTDYYCSRYYLTHNNPFLSLLQIATEDGNKINLDYSAREREINKIKQDKLEALKTVSLFPSESDADLAYNSLERTIASGTELASPAGAVVFKLTYTDADSDGDQDIFLGVYQSVEDAKRAAVAKIFETLKVENSWSEEIKTPWGNLDSSNMDLMNIKDWNKAKIEWFKSKTDDEILEWAESNRSQTMSGFYRTLYGITFDIDAVKVETVATPYIEETHLED